MSLISILSIVFVFSVLVIIHELGHFLAARWMGVRVEKFSIGFPPKVFSKKIGETEFTISAIPLGGFVKMAGFVDESMDAKITGADYEYSSKPVWRRIIIITAGVIMNLILAIVLYTGLSYYQGETIHPSTTIKISGESGIAKQIGFKNYDKILKINGTPVENGNQIYKFFFDNMDKGIDFLVMRGDKKLDLYYKKEWLSEKKGEILDVDLVFPAKVGEISSDMPAQKTGLKKGDVIKSLDNTPVVNWDDMTKIIRANPGKTIPIEWIRDNKNYSSTITPEVFHDQSDDAALKEYGIIGIRPFFITKPISFSKALAIGLEQPVTVIALNLKGLKWWITGVKSAKETMGGPITIAKMAAEAAEAGWGYLLNLTATLSVVLAFFNILPIPALDGGHLFFLIIEGITRKPLSIKTRLVVQQIGMALLLTFIIFALYVDFSRIL